MNRVTHLETFARAGYLARGIVYVMLGYLTIRTGRSEGTSTVLEDLQALPAGTAILAVTAVGLFGYAVFRLYGAAVDLEGNGTDAKGIGKRIGHAASGLAHLLLAYLSLQIAFGSGGDGSGGSAAGDMARSAPGGSVLLIAVGIGFAAAALDQLVKAITANFMTLMNPNAPQVAEIVGRLGHAARAVVFGILSWQVLRAGLGRNAGELSFETALDALRETGWAHTAVAAGLLLFGVFSLLLARYARVPNEDLLQRAKAHAPRQL